MNLMVKAFAKQCVKNLVDNMEPVQNLKFVDVILDSVEKNAMKLDVQVEIGVLVVQSHALAKVGADARPTQDNVYVALAGRVYIVKISAKRGLGA